MLRMATTDAVIFNRLPDKRIEIRFATNPVYCYNMITLVLGLNACGSKIALKWERMIRTSHTLAKGLFRSHSAWAISVSVVIHMGYKISTHSTTEVASHFS